ncbi:MAG: AAA domain-containing protein [Gammaproteobacteria bacterium]|nr:AAA domain-containing protein [Gammaproteobacteria bacterium]
MSLMADGHVLIEDVPGVGKTLLAKSLARSLDCRFHRVQFTPDLLPSDITGVSIWDRAKTEFIFKPGAIFANIVLGDEINRAGPKTQAALLEAMEELQVTVDGVTRPLPPPFMVIATQNPLEHEGTYPLPESQLDRFMMRLVVGYPTYEKEIQMLETHGTHSSFDDLKPMATAEDVREMSEIARHIHVAGSLQGYIVDVVEATRRHGELLLGASPRAALHLQRVARVRAAMQRRDFATPDDIKALARPVLEHRMVLRPEALMRGTTVAEVIDSVLRHVRVPGSRSG